MLVNLSNASYLLFHSIDRMIVCHTFQLSFLHVGSQDKLSALIYLLRNVCKENKQSLIFAATKHHVEYLFEVTIDTYAFNCVST